MDQRLQYEQLIAGKLESLPIPDMQDAIWSRIKAQLDIDMPTDDGGGDAGPQAPSGPGIAGWGLSALVVAIISIFFLYKNQLVTAPEQAPSAPTEKVSAPVEQTNGPPVSNQKQEALPVTQPAATPMILPFAHDSVQQNNLPAPLTLSADSTTLLPSVEGTASSPPPVASDTVQKKTRGVPGIHPDDYRIVPKKDSGQGQ